MGVISNVVLGPWHVDKEWDEVRRCERCCVGTKETSELKLSRMLRRPSRSVKQRACKLPRRKNEKPARPQSLQKPAMNRSAL